MAEIVNELSEKELYKQKMDKFFAKTNSIVVNDTKKLNNPTAFKSYTKKDVRTFLENPARNEKQLREISNYCYNTFGKYRRLINYMAQMPLFYYFLEPLNLKRDKVNAKVFEKAYTEACNYIDNMNIAHEFSKITAVAFKEDVFFGYVHETDENFCIQALDPDYCKITSIEDGVYNFAFDFAYFDKDPLKVKSFPKEFNSKYNKYKNNSTELQWQELDPYMSICLKVNEETYQYCMPPFANLFESLYDFSDYKALKKAREEIGNYQLISMQIPMSKDKPDEYLLDPDEAMEYYKMAVACLPPYVGLILSPMNMESVRFEKDTINSDRVDEAEKQFWNDAGVNANLFNSSGNSGAVVDLSIKTDEAMVFRFLRQIARWINRRLKTKSGKVKFKLSFLPVTINNQQSAIDQYLKLAQYGVPVKLQLCSLLGMSNDTALTNMYLENEVFGLTDKMKPLVSSHTQNGEELGGDSAGRPTTDTPSESTERGQAVDSNANKL